MNYSALQRANQIDEELRTVSRVLEHFKGHQSKDDPIEFIVKYLKECRNVGNDKTRKMLAASFISDSISFLEAKEKMLNEEFDAL